MKKILVPVDLSAATVQVCNAARDLAQSLGARLLILHIVPPPPVVLKQYALTPVEPVDFTREERKRAAEKLRALGHWFQKRCPNTRVLLHTGPVVPMILRTARLARADYLVLGSHGHTAAYEILIGSVAHGVLRRAPCPIVLVPIRQRARKQIPVASEAMTLVR